MAQSKTLECYGTIQNFGMLWHNPKLWNAGKNFGMLCTFQNFGMQEKNFRMQRKEERTVDAKKQSNDTITVFLHRQIQKPVRTPTDIRSSGSVLMETRFSDTQTIQSATLGAIEPTCKRQFYTLAIMASSQVINVNFDDIEAATARNAVKKMKRTMEPFDFRLIFSPTSSLLTLVSTLKNLLTTVRFQILKTDAFEGIKCDSTSPALTCMVKSRLTCSVDIDSSFNEGRRTEFSVNIDEFAQAIKATNGTNVIEIIRYQGKNKIDVVCPRSNPLKRFRIRALLQDPVDNRLNKMDCKFQVQIRLPTLRFLQKRVHFQGRHHLDLYRHAAGRVQRWYHQNLYRVWGRVGQHRHDLHLRSQHQNQRQRPGCRGVRPADHNVGVRRVETRVQTSLHGPILRGVSKLVLQVHGKVQHLDQLDRQGRPNDRPLWSGQRILHALGACPQGER